MPVPGDVLISRFSVIDGTGAPLTSETITLVGYDPSGAALSPNPATHLGSGVYQVSVPTSGSDPIGNYYLQARSSTVPVQTFELEWTVKPVGTPDRWRPGDVLMDGITVIDPTGVPVTGETFIVYAVGPTGNQINVPPPLELGNGVYRVAIHTSRFDPSGNYYIRLESASLPKQVFEVQFTTGQAVNVTGGTTLRTLRRRVMEKFGDIVSCRATSTTDTMSFRDDDNLAGEAGRFAGREIMFMTGLNAGQKRYITGSSRSSSTVNLNRALPFPVVEGDEADVTNAYGIGITFNAVSAAINYAIEAARTSSPLPMNFTAKAWDGAPIPIPVEVVGINDVYGLDSHGARHHIRRSKNAVDGWMVDRPNRTISINGYEGRQAKGYDVVVDARVLPSLLTDDDDVTMLPLEWLVLTATAHLCMDILLSKQSSGEWGSKGMLYQQRADQLRSTLSPNIGPNYTVVQ